MTSPSTAQQSHTCVTHRKRLARRGRVAPEDVQRAGIDGQDPPKDVQHVVLERRRVLFEELECFVILLPVRVFVPERAQEDVDQAAEGEIPVGLASSWVTAKKTELQNDGLGTGKVSQVKGRPEQWSGSLLDGGERLISVRPKSFLSSDTSVGFKDNTRSAARRKHRHK